MCEVSRRDIVVEALRLIDAIDLTANTKTQTAQLDQALRYALDHLIDVDRSTLDKSAMQEWANLRGAQWCGVLSRLPHTDYRERMRYGEQLTPQMYQERADAMRKMMVDECNLLCPAVLMCCLVWSALHGLNVRANPFESIEYDSVFEIIGPIMKYESTKTVAYTARERTVFEALRLIDAIDITAAPEIQGIQCEALLNHMLHEFHETVVEGEDRSERSEWARVRAQQYLDIKARLPQMPPLAWLVKWSDGDYRAHNMRCGEVLREILIKDHDKMYDEVVITFAVLLVNYRGVLLPDPKTIPAYVEFIRRVGSVIKRGNNIR